MYDVDQRTRSSQRARPHRMGGVPNRDTGSGVGRVHDCRGHAAQLDPADDDGRELQGKTRGGQGPVLDRRRILGWGYSWKLGEWDERDGMAILELW
jgi:hypothetical protein